MSEARQRAEAFLHRVPFGAAPAKIVRDLLDEKDEATVDALARVDALAKERDEARDELGTANGTNAILAAHLASTAESLQTAEVRVDVLTKDKERAVYLAQQLFQMIPREVWRDSGGDDGQGHYEGDYRAENVRDELASLAVAGETPQPCLCRRSGPHEYREVASECPIHGASGETPQP